MRPKSKHPDSVLPHRDFLHSRTVAALARFKQSWQRGPGASIGGTSQTTRPRRGRRGKEAGPAPTGGWVWTGDRPWAVGPELGLRGVCGRGSRKESAGSAAPTRAKREVCERRGKWDRGGDGDRLLCPLVGGAFGHERCGGGTERPVPISSGEHRKQCSPGAGAGGTGQGVRGRAGQNGDL
jgi:hypothetical protein